MTVQRRCAAVFSVGLLLSVIPSFLADVIRPERRRRASKLHSTSYLDGLRGLAAFSVFAYHYTDYNHKFFLPAYGSNPADQGSSLLQLPYIRVLYAGTPMVHIFFIISGFALAYRPLQCLYDSTSLSSSYIQNPRSSSIAKCHSLLASSAFRRPIRLFGPPLALTLAYVPLVLMGFMRNFLQPKPSLAAQLADWGADAVSAVAWPWGWDDGAPHSRYNPHLWTIPIEFAHSMLLFLVLLAVSRLRTALLRQAALALAMAYALLIYGRWAAFEFLAGALLADMHLGKDGVQVTEHTSLSRMHGHGPKEASPLFVAKALFHCFVLAGAGYIISWPSRPDDITPSYTWLQLHVPWSFVSDEAERGNRFWFAVAAFGVVWSCGRVQSLKQVLESSPAQYAGRISFAFYILQHPVLNICEHSVLGAPRRPATADKPAVRGWGVRGLTGESTPIQRTVCWFIGLCVLGSILICMADMFWRAIDIPFVRAARRLEVMVFTENDENSEILPVKK